MKNKSIKPENEFHGIEIKYSKICKTVEERDLFVDFISNMKILSETGKLPAPQEVLPETNINNISQMGDQC